VYTDLGFPGEVCAMASPFSLEKGGVGRAEYAKLIAENQKRYPNDRDRAVRSANIAAGFGSSTAQRYLHGAGAGGKAKAGGGGGGGGGGAGGGKTKAKPNKPGRGDTTGSTTSSPARPPDQMWQNPPPPSSPVRDPSLMWPGATGGGPPMQSPVPMNPALSQASILQTTPPDLTGGGGFPPDLAVSPPHKGLLWPSPPPNRPAVNIGPAGSTVPPRPAQVGGSIFNRGGFRNEPQDPNESWWQALLRG
jgi:hypothetical protein